MRKICWSPGLRGSAPDPAGGAYSAPQNPLAGGERLRGGQGSKAPSPRTPLTILSLCLSSVYVHTCMKMHCSFLLNVKHGASQYCCIWAGGLQLSSAGTGTDFNNSFTFGFVDRPKLRNTVNKIFHHTWILSPHYLVKFKCSYVGLQRFIHTQLHICCISWT